MESLNFNSQERELRRLKQMQDNAKENCMIQSKEGKVDSSKALDASLVVTECSRTKSDKQDTSNSSGNYITHDVDAYIRPVNDQVPLTEVDRNTTPDLTNMCHKGGEIDQNAEKCQVSCPLLDPSFDNMTTEFSNQSLESENISLKKTVAQLQKDFSRMEAHCVNMELKYQNQALKDGQHSQILNETCNKAKTNKEIEILETINIELEHSVAKLRAENEKLHNENEHLKQTYKDLYDSIKKTRVQTKDHNDLLIAQINRHRFSPNKSSDVHEKINTPRSYLRWIPTGRIFNTVGLRWVPTGKTFTSSTTKVDCKPPNGSNEDILTHLNVINSHVSDRDCVPTTPPSNHFVPPLRTDWDILFQPMFDEITYPPPISAVSTGSPSSTNVDQDAPSPSHSQTTPETKPPPIVNAGSSPIVNAGSSPIANTARSNGSQSGPYMFPFRNNATLEATHADFFDDETEVDMRNINKTYPVPSTPNTRTHKDHSLENVISNVQSGVQTRRMTNEQGFISAVYEGKTHEDLHTYLFACFLSQEEPKKLFAPVAGIEEIRLFLAYASFKDFVVYQMDVKSAFLYGKIEKEVYICQPLGFEDPEFHEKVYKVDKALYGLHQAPRACLDKYMDKILKKFGFSAMKTASTPMETSKPLLKDAEVEYVDVHLYRSMIGSLMYLTAFRPDIIIFRYLKGQPKLGLWYPKDSPFNLEAYTDSDYPGASLDRKSTTGAEYVAAASCCGQVLWIQNQMLDYGYNFMNTKIFIDKESTICIVKNLVFHSKTKHIEIRHHFIRDSYEKNLIQMIKIHTDLNVADLLTKAFDVGRF
ncbi:putative reverse transcriptase, RNA-dependent DNA polymerase [Tanacetum coccineum]